MNLGGAIGPKGAEIDAALRSAVEGVLQEKSAAAAALREVIEQQSKILSGLTSVADQLAAASSDLAASARSLAMRTTMPAPEVTVNVPEAPEPPEQEAPIVNVTVPEPVVNVTFQEPAEQEKGTRKRVVRDPVTRLITEIIEEPI